MSNSVLAPLFVLSGPSGVGKTTVVERVLAAAKVPLRRAITATSRAPRPGELNGTHYHFWSRERFQEAIAANQMLEYAVVHGKDYYGTPLSEVEPHRSAGVGVLLVIDVQGAEQVRRIQPERTYTIFLTVSNWDSLRERLINRGEPEASIQRRLVTAQAELSRSGEFDECIPNDDLETTVAALIATIESHFPLEPGDSNAR